MDPNVAFWLGAIVSVVVMLGGWRLTKWADDVRSKREGNFDRPSLAITVLGLPVVENAPLEYIYIVQDPPDSPLLGNIAVTVGNKGNRAAESVLVHVTRPNAVMPLDGQFDLKPSGLFPGSEAKHEKIGSFSRLSSYVPHLMPGGAVRVNDLVALQETSVSSTVEVSPVDAVAPTSLTYRLDYAWSLNVQVISKERVWPTVSVRIRVVHGKALVEAARMVRDAIVAADRKRFKIGDEGQLLARPLSRFRYWRFRAADHRHFYFKLTGVGPAPDRVGTPPWPTEDEFESKYYVMFDTGRQWLLMRSPTSADTADQELELVVLPAEMSDSGAALTK